MRLITYQSKEAVDILLTTGELKVTDTNQMRTYHFFDDSFGANRFKEGYDYIINRMHKLIKDKSDYDSDIISPIWGWYKYVDINELNNDNIHDGFQRKPCNIFVPSIYNSLILIYDYI